MKNVTPMAELRYRKGLTQKELACRIEVFRGYYNLIENGKIKPGSELVGKIARALEMDEGIVLRAILKSKKEIPIIT